MIRTAVGHWLRTQNTGDLFSAPYHYYDLGEAVPFDVTDFRPPADCQVYIYGGGALAGRMERARLTKPKEAKLIAWGVGSTVRGSGPSFRARPDGFNLYGSRDKGHPRTDYVPCVSCKNAIFDYVPSPSREVVAFWNADPAIPTPTVDPRIPVQYNNRHLTFIFNHLASARYVLTNSYHGAYWSMLMGRRPILVDPYSSKFHFMPLHAPSIRSGQQWEDVAEQTEIDEHLLLRCRELNDRFYNQVVEVVNETGDGINRPA